MIKFKDVAHLYLGCQVLTQNGVAELTTVGKLGSIGQRFRVLFGAMSREDLWEESFKPLLRPLNSMTYEECELFNVVYPMPEKYSAASDDWKLEEVRQLLSKHFDLFGLIESGQALDIIKYKQNENTTI